MNMYDHSYGLAQTVTTPSGLPQIFSYRVEESARSTQIHWNVEVKVIEEFHEQVPSTLNFSIGYFEGYQSRKSG